MMALSELGYQVDLLTLPIGTDESIENVSVIRAWNFFGSTQIAIGPSLLKLWFSLILLIQGTGLVLRNRYDVVHGNEEAGFVCYLLSLISRAKCIFEKHSDSKSYSPKWILKPVLSLYRGAEALTAKKSKVVISTGPALDEQARVMSGGEAPEGKFHMIPDTPSSTVEASAEDIKKIRQQLISESDQVLVTYAGSFASYQGIDIIFDAMPDILRNTPNARFVIIGGSQQEITDYQSALQQQGVNDEVQFLGKIDPDLLPAYLAASDILLAPRKSGVNSPLKILDYFKAGAAIVATNTVANKRLLNNENAMLCEFSVADFSTAISTLVTSPEKRQSIGQKAHELYQSTYNFKMFKSQIKKAYDACLA